ncbi:heavy metal translocating P-type ATPase metal-binding domain-containing protein [Rapidithrix thailandica]|uniref:Heavy metal translocating P-type ATPase metal-binding domain-containing protein n=1 Tax=Rapidithrix thailandica TaxID=413964 RepID=A0AAW9RQ04_9BACT
MKQIEKATTCYHCGEDCEETLLFFEEKPFCCQGCQTVYQLLSENDLSDYYCIENQPGLTQKERGSADKFAYLDDDSIRQKLIDFSDQRLTKISFYLPQIHCASCVWLLEKLPQLHEGVLQSKVNFLKKELYISFDENDLSLRKLVELLWHLGYEPHISLEDFDKKERKASTQTQSFYIKLGITGFCFGNIMMLSFPEYLGISHLDADFIRLFGYINLFLSLPVFFYGASDYLRSAWTALSHKTVNIDVPISLGIFALFGRSIYEILSQTGAGYLDSLASLIFLLLIGKWFQQKTFENISFERDYKSYFPIAVTTLQGTQEQTTPLEKLKEKDVIVVRSGELIPADALLLQGEARIDYSFVTGESNPVPKKTGELIYAGGRQRGGILHLQIIKEVSQSYLTRLWNEQIFQKQGFTGLHNKTNLISKYFTLAILLVAFGAGTYWWLQDAAGMAVNTFTAVLIIACPCALALNAPFTLGNALRILARFKLFLKDTEVIERMAETSHIVFDKTGTITRSGEDKIRFQGEALSPGEQEQINALVNHSTHPVSKEIAGYLNLPLNGQRVEHFEENTGQGISAFIGQQEVRLGKARFVSEQAIEKPKEIFQTTAYVSFDKVIKGYFQMKQSLREGIENLIRHLSGTYQLSLLSGDNEGEKTRLAHIFPAGSTLAFQQSPEQKMRFIEQLQQKGNKVMMLGDGLNDAGALKQSDVGLAITENVHQFSPACDGILHATHLPQLHRFLTYSKRCMQTVYGGFILSLLYNIVGLSFAVQGTLSPIVAAILMPLSSITVVTYGVLSSSYFAKHLEK